MNWDPDEGTTELPLVTSFSVAALPQAMMAILLRYSPADPGGAEKFLFEMGADAARELALSLLQAADVMSETAGTGRLN